MMIESYYCCSICGTPSFFMKLTDEIYEPSFEERKNKPDLLFIGNEILLCACGKENTWFDMIKK